MDPLEVVLCWRQQKPCSKPTPLHPKLGSEAFFQRPFGCSQLNLFLLEQGKSLSLIIEIKSSTRSCKTVWRVKTSLVQKQRGTKDGTTAGRGSRTQCLDLGFATITAFCAFPGIPLAYGVITRIIIIDTQDCCDAN